MKFGQKVSQERNQLYESSGSRKTYKNILSILLIILISWYFRIPLFHALKEMKEIQGWQIVLILLLTIGYIIFDGIVYSDISVPLSNQSITKMEGIRCIVFASFFKVISLGTATWPSAIYYMSKKNVTVSDGTSITIVSYIIHKLIVALVAIVLVGTNFKYYARRYEEQFPIIVISVVLAVLIAFFIFLLCTSKKLHRVIITSLYRINRKINISDHISAMENYFNGLEASVFRILKNKKQIGLVIIENTAKLLCIYLIPFVILMQGIDESVIELVTLCAIACALASILPSIGGVGAIEVSFLLVFTGICKKEEILSCALLFRFVTYYLPGIISGILIACKKGYEIYMERS